LKSFKLTALAVLAALLLAGSTGIFAQGKIVFLDSQKILESYTAFQDAQKQVEELTKTYETEYQNMQTRGQKLVEELESQRLLLSPEKKTQKENEIRTLQAQMDKFRYEKLGPQGELYQKNQELIQPIFDKINSLITKVSEQEGYDLVLDKAQGALLYGAPDIDITQRVLDELDKAQ